MSNAPLAPLHPSRPLDQPSAEILDHLTADLTAPPGFGLIGLELDNLPARSAPTVRAERLSAERYVITRFVEVDTRIEDPEVNDRVAAPAVEFVRHGDVWFPVAAQRGVYEGPERDIHALAAAMLRIVAEEQSLRPYPRWFGKLVRLLRPRPRLGGR